MNRICGGKNVFNIRTNIIIPKINHLFLVPRIPKALEHKNAGSRPFFFSLSPLDTYDRWSPPPIISMSPPPLFLRLSTLILFLRLAPSFFSVSPLI